MKSNFLAVYGQVHIKALTSGNIKSAFKKTGVVPFNPDVITANLLAPSQPLSSTGVLPLEPPSPIRVMQDMIHRQLARCSAQAQATNYQENAPTAMPLIPQHERGMSPAHIAVTELASTSASFLVSSSPMESSSHIPKYQLYHFSPLKRHYSDILSQTPSTELEKELQDALRECENCDWERKHAMINVQAMVILQGAYVERNQQQLQEYEVRKKRKSLGTQVLGDGMPKLLTANKVVQLVEDNEKRVAQEKAEKEERKRQREEHGKVLAEWKKAEEERKARNEELRRKHHEAVRAWEAERDSAKSEGCRARWTKSKLGPVEKPLQKPKKSVVVEANSDDEHDELESVEGSETDDEN